MSTILHETPPARQSDPQSTAEGTAQTDSTAVATNEIGTIEHGKKLSRAERKKIARLTGGFVDYPHLLSLKPKEHIVFRSDYFEVDNSFACILGFFHTEGARDNFGPFWGINRVPHVLTNDATAVVLEQVRRQTEKWVESHMKTAERIVGLSEGEQNQTGSNSAKRKAERKTSDIDKVTEEIQNGASYLHVHDRLFVKADSLASLDENVERITRSFVDVLPSLKLAAYPGEQRQEYAGLFQKNEKKRGKGEYFTSTEFAGSYHLVTNGLNDLDGEYVGVMTGDLNTSAVVFNVDRYDQRVVVASDQVHYGLGRQLQANVWGSKLSQAALLENHRVVHLVLDSTNLDLLGPDLSRLTAKLDLNRGEVNMFELFGKPDEELSVFAVHMQKLSLMMSLITDLGTDDKAVATGIFQKALQSFYIDKRMWMPNAQQNVDRLRILGLEHSAYPRLYEFTSYLQSQRAQFINTNDQSNASVSNKLQMAFENLLTTNADLFNNTTSGTVDGVTNRPRMVYDFSSLARRGTNIAMAQLVNVIGFAVDALGEGDTVIIHGTENIAPEVKSYVQMQLGYLTRRGGRVAFLYNDVDKMLADRDFNMFDAADYTILGRMREKTVEKYQELLHMALPTELTRLVTSVTDRGELTYLRRGVMNVVFHADISLGMAQKKLTTFEPGLSISR